MLDDETDMRIQRTHINSGRSITGSGSDDCRDDVLIHQESSVNTVTLLDGVGNATDLLEPERTWVDEPGNL